MTRWQWWHTLSAIALAASRAAGLFAVEAKTDERDAAVIARTALGVPDSLSGVPGRGEALEAARALSSQRDHSGTSVRSVRASRRGDARLKSLLIFSCNSLVRSSGRYGEYYRACRARGMGHGRALKAVARKRLRAIYAVMRDRVPYRE